MSVSSVSGSSASAYQLYLQQLQQQQAQQGGPVQPHHHHHHHGGGAKGVDQSQPATASTGTSSVTATAPIGASDDGDESQAGSILDILA